MTLILDIDTHTRSMVGSRQPASGNANSCEKADMDRWNKFAKFFGLVRKYVKSICRSGIGREPGEKVIAQPNPSVRKSAGQAFLAKCCAIVF